MGTRHVGERVPEFPAFSWKGVWSLTGSSEAQDRNLVFAVLTGEGAEDLMFLLREELRFLRALRRQSNEVQEAFLAHRRIRSATYTLSRQEAEDLRDPIFRATGIRG